MKINNIKINNYGNLENKEINLKNKINIIYGKNESGKSTLLNYIKNIFYGISKNKNGKFISDFEKYKPWGKEDFSGKLEYELDSGEKFEIFRDFTKKNPKVFNDEFEDISKEFNIVKKDGTQFFYEQTGIDESMFISTVVSMQSEVKLDKDDQNVLVQKLANLTGTGDDNLSYKKVIDKLNKMQIEEIGSDRSQGRPINIVKERMKNIEFVLKELYMYQKDKQVNEDKKRDYAKKIDSLKAELGLLQKVNIIQLWKQSEEEKLNIKNTYKNEKNKKIEELNLEKNKLNRKIEENNLKKINKKIKNKTKEKNNYNINNEKNNKINYNFEKNSNNEKNKKIINNNKKNKIKKYFFITLLFLLINIIIFIINKNTINNKIINILNCFIIPIYLIIIFILQKNKKIKINKQIEIENEKINNEIKLINKQIELLQEELNKDKEEINKEQINIDNKIEIDLENLKKEYGNILNANKYLEEILDNNSDNLNNLNYLINITQENINKNNFELQALKIKDESISSKLENMVNLKEEYDELEEKLNNLEERNNAINLTKEFLTKAYINMKNNVTPKFTENLSKNISNISNGKYTKVKINDDKGLIVENKFGEYVPAELLSIGTIDQLYLSLRLSMIDDLSNEKMPIILDEAFAYFDDDRLENILKFLNDNLKEHQVIIFTCTEREKEVLDNMGIEYNLVELNKI